MDRRLPSAQSLPATCQGCRVRHRGICAVLGPEELQRLAAFARHTRHGAGETLAVESDEATVYANVTSGTVKLSRVLRDGRQQLVGLQFAPDLMGRLFSDESPLSAEAATEVELCRVPKDVIEALVVSSERLKLRLLDQALKDLDDAREWMVTLGRKSAVERVASMLLLIAARSGATDTGSEVVVDLPISRADMADFLGLTVETVSRQMSRLRHEGVITIHGHRCVVIGSLATLKARTG